MKWQDIKDSFYNLPPRERLYVLAGGLLVCVIIFYALVWSPLGKNITALQNTAKLQQEDLSWMQTAGKKIKQLQRANPNAGRSAGRSLLAIVDQNMNSAGLKGALQRMEPDGSNKVKLWLDQGPFDALVSVLGKLEQEHGIGVLNLSITPSAKTGLVDARITLSRGDS